MFHSVINSNYETTIVNLVLVNYFSSIVMCVCVCVCVCVFVCVCVGVCICDIQKEMSQTPHCIYKHESDKRKQISV